MKIRQLIFSSALALALCGCASNPLYTSTPVVTPSGTNYLLTLSPATSNALATAQQFNNSFVPAPFNGVVDAILAAVALGLGAYARYANSKAAQQRAAADLLAATVVQSKAQQTALKVASGTSAFQAVAQHIDNNTTTE